MIVCGIQYEQSYLIRVQLELLYCLHREITFIRGRSPASRDNEEIFFLFWIKERHLGSQLDAITPLYLTIIIRLINVDLVRKQQDRLI